MGSRPNGCRPSGNKPFSADEIFYVFFSSAGNDDGAFFIHPLGGIITVAQPLDSETKASYDLTITASDGFNQVSRSVRNKPNTTKHTDIFN